MTKGEGNTMGRNKYVNPQRSALNNTQLFTADITTIANKYVEVGRYAVPQGMGVALGYGPSGLQDSASGRMYIKMIDDTAGDATEETGMTRIEVRNAQDRFVKLLFEGSSDALSASTTRSEQIPFAEMNEIIGYGYSIVMLFKSAAADVVQYDFSKVQLDVTTYDAVNG